MFTKLNCTYCFPSMLIPLYSCLERSQMFTKFASMQSLPTTVSKWQIHAQLSKKHSQMFTKLNCTYCLPSTNVNSTIFLPRIFTNVHKVCLYAKLTHNSLKMENPCTVVYKKHSQMLTKLNCTYCLPSTNVNSTILLLLLLLLYLRKHTNIGVKDIQLN